MKDSSWLSPEGGLGVGRQVVFGMDRAGCCTLSAGAGLAALGFRPGELVGTDLREFYRDDPLASEAIATALAGEAFQSERAYQGRHLSVYIQPLHDASGTLTGAVGVTTDVTEQRQIEHEARASRRKAHHLDNLSAVLTHEVLGLPELLGVVVRAVTEAAADIGVLWLRPPDGQRLSPAAAWRRTAPELDLADRIPRDSSGASRYDCPASVADELSAPRLLELSAPDATDAADATGLLKRVADPLTPHAALRVPLRSRGLLIGMVELARTERLGPFSEEDVSLVADIAQRCSLALDNAILLEAHRRAREELVKFQALADASDNLIGISDNAHQLVYLNPQVAALGLPATDRDVWTVLARYAGQQQSDEIRAQLDATGRWSGEVPPRLTGQARVAHLDVFRLRHPETEAALGTAWIAQDITELRLANADLSRFKALVDASPDFIAIAGLDGCVQYVNPGGRSMIGMAADVDVTATRIEDYLTPEGLAASIAVEQPAVLAHGHFEGESTLRSLRGDAAIPVAIASFLMRDTTTGEPFALATVQRDITERHAAETALRELARQREALLTRLVDAQEAERVQIAADVHDDTVQACAAVDLRLGLLRRQLRDQAPDLLEGLETVQASVSGATDRLRALLFDLEPPDLSRGLAPALSRAAQEIFEDTPIRSSVDGRGEPAMPEATRAIAYRIAKEALVNIVKHAQARQVALTVADADGGLEVAIRDDGVGPGPQGSRSAAGHRGIASMQDRAALAGGRCTIGANPRGGTCVTIWLPGLRAH